MESSIPHPIPVQKGVVAALTLPCALLKACRVWRDSYPDRQMRDDLARQHSVARTANFLTSPRGDLTSLPAYSQQVMITALGAVARVGFECLGHRRGC